MSADRTPPAIAGMLETAVYVDDIARADRFYSGVLGLRRMLTGDRLWAYDVGPSQVLLLCARVESEADIMLAGGRVPGHRGDGPAHFAFLIEAASYEEWKAHLKAMAIPILSEVTWSPGARSLYVHDPDGNVVEFMQFLRSA